MYIKNTFIAGKINGLRSDAYSPETEYIFTMINSSTETIQRFLILSTGERLEYNPPSGPFTTHIQPSTSTAAWEIRDMTGRVLADFISTDDIYIWDGTALTGYQRFLNVTNIGNAKFSSAYGYGLINVAKALGVPESIDTTASSDNGNSAAINEIKGFGISNAGYTGKGVVIAILDTGVDSSIPSLIGRVINGYDFGSDDNDSTPTSQTHGNIIAGIIGATNNSKNIKGLAPESTILNVKITNDNGNGSNQSIADGIRYAVDHGARIISISQGDKFQLESIKNLTDAARYAVQNNVLIVSAAGNDSFPYIAGPTNSFKDLDTIVVGNWDLQYDKLFYSSNWAGDDPINFVVAPSSGWTTSGRDSFQYFRDGGTSFSTPYVSALAALIIQQHPDWTVNQIINQIVSTSTFIDIPKTSIARPPNSLNVINGELSNDTIFGTINNDYILGNSGNDSIYGINGEDIIDGGDGFDTVQLEGNLSNYRIQRIGDKYVIQEKNGQNITNIVKNIELLKFDDFSVNLVIQKSSLLYSKKDIANIEGIFVAIFECIPSAEDLFCLLEKFKQSGDLNKFANDLYDSYSPYLNVGQDFSGISDEDFINNIYKNFLGRTSGAEHEGLNYWKNKLSIEHISRGVLVFQILESIRSFASDEKWGWVVDNVNNKIAIANTFAVDLGLAHNDNALNILNDSKILNAATFNNIEMALSIVGINPIDIQLS